MSEYSKSEKQCPRDASMDMKIDNDGSSSISWDLCCQVIDDRNKPLDSVFSIRIASSADIDDLKKDIFTDLPKAARQHFAGLSPTDLDLWKLCNHLSIATTKDIFEGELAGLHVSDPDDRHEAQGHEAQLLNPSLEIGECWDSEPPEKSLHLVVRAVRAPPREDTSTDTGPYSKHSQPDLTFDDLKAFYAQYWGCPLDASLTTLPRTTGLDDLELGNEMDRNGDVLPGDPFLEVFNQKLLVRAEYIRIFNQVKAVYDGYKHKRLAVVTGQPGIGKTSWIPYAIRRCLGEKRPVIWYKSGKFFAFSAAGVDVLDSVSGGDVWCFVDSAAADRLPCMIYHPRSRLFPIFVTSPKKTRWNELRDLRSYELVIMNPWTKEELLKARRFFPERTPADISERFNNAGPSARLCLEFSSTDIGVFYSKRNDLIKMDTSQCLFETLLDSKGHLRIYDISHQLCVLRRSNPITDFFWPFVVEPISPFVRQALRIQLREWKDQDRVDMMERFRWAPGAGGILNLLFESHCHQQFGKNIEIVAGPMSPSNHRGSPWLADFSAASALPPLHISILPSRLQTYNDSEKLKLEEDVYYVPLGINEVSADSFILHAGHLYMFQFTCGQRYTANRSLLDALLQFSNCPASANQHLVFVVPNYITTFRYPRSDNGFLSGHVPYVAQVRMN